MTKKKAEHGRDMTLTWTFYEGTIKSKQYKQAFEQQILHPDNIFFRNPAHLSNKSCHILYLLEQHGSIVINLDHTLACL